MAVDDLTTDLNLNLLEEEVTQAALGTTRPSSQSSADCICIGKGDLYITLPDKVSIAVHDSNNALTIHGGTGEVHAECLNSKVGMALVEHLPERNMRIAREVGILSTISNELK
jgi:hypothetical protein